MAVQEFVIENVPDGTYMLVLSKPAHLDITIKDVKVEGGDLALSTEGDTTDKDGTYLLFGAGDLDGNGRINVNDMNMVTASSTYNKTSEQAANKIADIDGSGTINVTDKNIISSTNNYNKASGQFTYKAINQN
jgi:Ca2+-binding EF-hand superfamily protein